MNVWQTICITEKDSLRRLHDTLRDVEAMLERACPALERAECNAECVQQLNANVWGVVVQLRKDADPTQARAIIFALTREFGDGRKEKSVYSDKDSLSVKWGEYPNATLVVTHYRPAECRIVKKQRIIPAKPATEEHVEEYDEIMCDEGSEHDNKPVSAEPEVVNAPVASA